MVPLRIFRCSPDDSDVGSSSPEGFSRKKQDAAVVHRPVLFHPIGTRGLPSTELILERLMVVFLREMVLDESQAVLSAQPQAKMEFILAMILCKG